MGSNTAARSHLDNALQSRNTTPVNVQAAIKELSRTLGPPKPRAAFGTWTTYAWLVRGLVEKGHGVTSAVNHVLDNSGLEHNDTAFGSLRAAYYKLKDAEWPAELSNAAAKGTEPEDTTFE